VIGDVIDDVAAKLRARRRRSPAGDDPWIFRAGRAAPQSDPEQAIERGYGPPEALAFEHGESLSEAQDFERCAGAAEEENADSGGKGADERGHE